MAPKNQQSGTHGHLNGILSHPDTPDASLDEAANRKLNKYSNHYANNHSISFLPATSTSAHMHGKFLRLLILQAHRETEVYFAFMDTPAQPDQDQFCFRRAAFYSSLKSKIGLIAPKAAALRVNMNTDRQLPDSLARCVSAVSTPRIRSRLLPLPLFPPPTHTPALVA